jgi:hypothetical protein
MNTRPIACILEIFHWMFFHDNWDLIHRNMQSYFFKRIFKGKSRFRGYIRTNTIHANTIGFRRNPSLFIHWRLWNIDFSFVHCWNNLKVALHDVTDMNRRSGFTDQHIINLETQWSWRQFYASFCNQLVEMVIHTCELWQYFPLCTLSRCL